MAGALALVSGLCALAFGAGWAVARRAGADPARRASLVFGLGMNNNGTGLALAAAGLSDHLEVVLPVIVYNLAQHLAAGVAGRALARQRAAGPAVAER